MDLMVEKWGDVATPLTAPAPPAGAAAVVPPPAAPAVVPDPAPLPLPDAVEDIASEPAPSSPAATAPAVLEDAIEDIYASEPAPFYPVPEGATEDVYGSEPAPSSPAATAPAVPEDAVEDIASEPALSSHAATAPAVPEDAPTNIASEPAPSSHAAVAPAVPEDVCEDDAAALFDCQLEDMVDEAVSDPGMDSGFGERLQQALQTSLPPVTSSSDVAASSLESAELETHGCKVGKQTWTDEAPTKTKPTRSSELEIAAKLSRLQEIRCLASKDS